MTAARSLVELLGERVEGEPGSVALRVKRLGLWEEVTWAQLGSLVRHLTAGLAELGLGKGGVLAVVAEASPEAVALDLSCQSLGGLSLPISPLSSAADVRYLLHEAGVRILAIGDLETADRLRVAPELDGLPIESAVLVEGTVIRAIRDWRLLTLDELEQLGRRREGDAEVSGARSGDEPISLHSTAGASGHPRLAAITSANLIAAWSELFAAWAPNRDDSFVVEAPPSHVIGQTSALLLPLLYGAIAHFPEHPAAVDEAMADVVPTLSLALPPRWEFRQAEVRSGIRESGFLNRAAYQAALAARRKLPAAARAARRPLPDRLAGTAGRWLVLRPIVAKLGLHRLRAAAVGGQYVPPDLLEFWLALGVPLTEFYGLTEAGGLVAFQPRPGEGLRPLSSVTVDVADSGEIRIKGPGVAAAHRGVRTEAHRSSGGWLATGDRGELTPAGTLRLSHRLSDVTTVGGKPVPIVEIERLLKAQGYIRRVAVVGAGRPHLAALVELDFPTVAAWARANSVRYGAIGSLAEEPRVWELIATAVEVANAQVEERALPPLKAFKILPATAGFEQMDVLAPTGELRRGEVETRYAAVVQSMYPEGDRRSASAPKQQSQVAADA